jgi:hypothetical protein
MKFYLIQRGKIQKQPASKKVSDVVQLDYMGSAEFEFGALPASLRAMQAAQKQYSLFRLVINGKDVHVWASSEVSRDELKEQLTELAEKKLWLKERSEFDYWFRKEKSRWEQDKDFKPFTFWWDIKNHIMFSLNGEFMKKLPECLQASWTFMDEQKKEDK